MCFYYLNYLARVQYSSARGCDSPAPSSAALVRRRWDPQVYLGRSSKWALGGPLRVCETPVSRMAIKKPTPACLFLVPVIPQPTAVRRNGSNFGVERNQAA
jgi:hypothetical protein